LQDQLSVVRASLLQHLAHKAALELKVKHQQSSNGAAATKLKLVVAGHDIEAEAANSGDAAGQLQDDVTLFADGSPKRRGRSVQHDQADRTSRPASPCPVLQAAAAVDAETASESSVLPLEDTAAGAAAAEQPADAKTPASVAHTLQAEAAEAAQHDTAGSLDSFGQAAAVTASSAAVLLTAAAKLQRLVEQLTQREPAAAADLSLLQWQLTTMFGSMTGAPSRSRAVSPMLDHSNDSGPGLSSSPAAETTASAEVTAAGNCDSSSGSTLLQDAPVTPAGSMKLLPADTHPLAEEAAAAAAGHPAQHSAAEVAAAARLFSGAATTLQAPSIDWYYLEEGGSVRGGCGMQQLSVVNSSVGLPGSVVPDHACKHATRAGAHVV
jgi:hypothetical protein